ncbi:MAG: hypothetical protein PHQ28_14085 [Mycobacterium sp.]|nr:hypothetical protein [Mycobacterium sp.]
MTKAHPDGGTVETLQLAETRNGWAIAITRWTTYRNTVVFEVLRVAPDNKALRIGRANTEAHARKLANAAWSADR